jgi:hypothetical protein
MIMAALGAQKRAACGLPNLYRLIRQAASGVTSELVAIS